VWQGAFGGLDPGSGMQLKAEKDAKFELVLET